MTIILAFLLGIVLGVAILAVLYFRQKARYTEELQSSATRVQILEAQVQADKKHFDETMSISEENHRQAISAQEVRFKEALASSEENHRQALSAQEVRFKEALASSEENHRQAISAQEVRFKEAQDLAEENHRQAISAQEVRFKEAQDLAEEKHRQVISAQEARFKETQDLTEEKHRQALAAQEVRFQETLQRVTLEMKSATDEMLKQRQQEFSASSSQNIGQIVAPLKDTIEAMRRTMNDSNLRHTELSSAMKEQIQLLMKQSEAARLSAEELARVFKHGSKVQGDWGEAILCELLDAHGLTQGVHYDTQITMRDGEGRVLKSEQGSMLRPDVILHLDNKREVVIDSKVSLTAFMDYVNAENEDERQRYLKAHVDSLLKHVKELAAKDYSSYIHPPKVRMDYVIMFVPHSGALWTALNAQPDMWRKAMERNVFIADEQTLFAALRIVSLTWTQIAQAENHERVYALANEIMDRVGQFMKKYQAVGRALETAQKAYDEGDKKLQPSGQSILQTCAKLQKLGAKQSVTNPLPQINAALEE